VALVTATASPAVAALYRWVDAAGVIHYTSERDTIPEAHRSSAHEVDHPSARAAQPSASPAPRGVVPVQSGAPVMVDAYLNGVPLRLLLDTGADRTVISPVALARAGIDPSQGTPVQITGVTGSSPASLVSVQRLDVAGAQIGPLGVIAHVVPGQELDGLLGRDVLDAFTVTFDAGQNRVILAPR
jgi:predicted aspartyl protease